MEIKTLILKNEEIKTIKDTETLIQLFYFEYLKKDRGALVLLEGNLGAGKTMISKMIGAFMGIQEEINSPSFVVYNMYKNDSMVFFHYDLYRIHPLEIEEMELRELWYDVYDNLFTIHCVEWWKKAKTIESSLPIYLVQLKIIQDLESDFKRKIYIYKINQNYYE
ncbi:MAG: tRNA (adenosine(37)-N6)-threonylcarbamoyltransferase complex ATPase subunit type 1 TsaE [Leptonema sp. (in: bacteria)]